MRPSSYFSVPAFLASALLAGCIAVSGPTGFELHSPDSPPAEVEAKIERILPRVLAWHDSVSMEFLARGRQLISPEMDLARKLGVSHPENVRLVVAETFPMPGDPELHAQVRRHGMGSWLEGGRANGYLIMIKPRVAASKAVLAHELVHVSQYERMGREAFFRRYLLEMEMLGYALSPLELEAFAKSEDEQ